MTQTLRQFLPDYRKASEVVRKKHNIPAKARQFLTKAGILKKHARSRNGIRLAKPHR
jgi:hypothetical protein